MAGDPSSREFSTVESYVRHRPLPPRPRAIRRLEEYLTALGLEDGAIKRAAAHRLVEELEALDVQGDELVAVAIEEMGWRIDRWLHLVSGARAEQVDPGRLRVLLRSRGDLFLSTSSEAQALGARLVDGALADGPRRKLTTQKLSGLGWPRWMWLIGPAFVFSLAVTTYLGWTLARDDLMPLEAAWLVLFGVLLTMHGIAATLVTAGIARRLHTRFTPSGDPPSTRPIPRTAIVVPIYQEDAQRVFAGVAAMREELQVLGVDGFEIFVLSDTRDPRIAAEEERSWRRVAHADRESIPVFYRRRDENRFQKSGNLAEFCERWNHRYRYFVVLDADSLMQGATLLSLVDRMEADPQLGLLQAPVELARGATPLARMLQLAHSVAGPVFSSGLAAIAADHGNYFGHNAIIRMKAFVRACGLPVLSGEPPLGGPILSHDFVEAALLIRAGWHVRMADDLGGSYEESPPTLEEFIKRDRRWCQGNLQHVRILFARGLAPMSRIHLAMGAAAYLVAPLWLLFLVVSGLWVITGVDTPASLVIGLWATIAGLLVPKVLGGLDVVFRRRVRAHGGFIRLTLGVFLELAIGAFLAPVLMIHHTRIVLEVLLGGAVGWTPQRRRARPGRLFEVWRHQRVPTLLGFATTTGALVLGGPALWWLLVSVPLVFAVPVSLVLGSESVGLFLKRLRILSTPPEAKPVGVLRRTEALLGFTAEDDAARFRDLVLDPVLHHDAVRVAKSDALTEQQRTALIDKALRAGPAGLTEVERNHLLDDGAALSMLHRRAWAHWPVEGWALARDLPSLPRDDIDDARTAADVMTSASSSRF